MGTWGTTRRKVPTPSPSAGPKPRTLVAPSNTDHIKAFNEWMRQCTEEPEEFERDWQATHEYLVDVAEGREPTYGQQCAAFFCRLLEQQQDDADEIAMGVGVDRKRQIQGFLRGVADLMDEHDISLTIEGTEDGDGTKATRVNIQGPPKWTWLGYATDGLPIAADPGRLRDIADRITDETESDDA